MYPGENDDIARAEKAFEDRRYARLTETLNEQGAQRAAEHREGIRLETAKMAVRVTADWDFGEVELVDAVGEIITVAAALEDYIRLGFQR
jgi:hypothetical protein